MEDQKYSLGDPVWAKLKGFSPWPGKVAKAPDTLKQPAAKKKAHCVYFFGTENYAFIESKFIKPFQAYRDELQSANKSNQFKEALAEMDRYVADCAKYGQFSGVERAPPPPQQQTAEDTPTKKKSFVSSGGGGGGGGDSRARKSVAGQSTGKKSADPVNGTTQSAVAGRSAKKHKMTAGDTRDSTPSAKRRKARSPSSSSSTEASECLAPDSGAAGASSSSPGADLLGASPALISSSTKRVASLLDRPTIPSRPDTPPLDLGHLSSTLRDKNVEPSDMRIGLVGLGAMGAGMARNLLNSRHQLTVWNRSTEKCEEFVKAGAEVSLTPSDVVATADITFLCVSDSQVSKEIIFGNCGVLQEINTTKAYVEMTTVGSETSQDVADAIGAKGGRYLEAQVQGSREQAEEGSLVIICAGDRSLFDDCQSCFQAMAKNSFYFGEVGTASRMNLVLQLLRGVQMAALAEALALADRAGLKLTDVMDVLALTSQASPLLLQKGKAIIDGTFSAQMALKHMQKDMRLCMVMSDQLEQSLPLTAAANEIFKHAKRVGYGDHDVSSVYIRARF